MVVRSVFIVLKGIDELSKTQPEAGMCLEKRMHAECVFWPDMVIWWPGSVILEGCTPTLVWAFTLKISVSIACTGSTSLLQASFRSCTAKPFHRFLLPVNQEQACRAVPGHAVLHWGPHAGPVNRRSTCFILCLSSFPGQISKDNVRPQCLICLVKGSNFTHGGDHALPGISTLHRRDEMWDHFAWGKHGNNIYMFFVRGFRFLRWKDTQWQIN